MMAIMVYLFEIIYEIFSNEKRKSFFYLKKWKKNCRCIDKPVSNVKAPAYLPTGRPAKFKSMTN
jgi:hypothetical protein